MSFSRGDVHFEEKYFFFTYIFSHFSLSLPVMQVNISNSWILNLQVLKNKINYQIIIKNQSNYSILPYGYTPQQNGIVKSMNRILLERIRAMLRIERLAKSFWTERIKLSYLVINWSPSTPSQSIILAYMY